MRFNTYAEFLQYVERQGVLWFSGKRPAGLPSLDTLTLEAQWHTGEPDTDPWRWKDRAASERRLAFGCLLGGHKGFLSPALYPLFYAASRPVQSLRERYEDGLVPRMALAVYELFAPGAQLSTADLRQVLLGAERKEEAKLDAAIVALQREYYLTVSGNTRRRNARGEPYGWAINTYARAEDWHGDWIAGALPTREEARARILAHCHTLGAADEASLRKALWGKG